MATTPRTLARQIRNARNAQANVIVAGSRHAFTSETGVVRPERIQTPNARTKRIETWEDYCFICGRCTDHTSEHYDVAEYSEQSTRESYDPERDTLYIMHESSVSRAEGPGLSDEFYLNMINAWRD